MFILSILDHTAERQALEERLKGQPDIHLDFANSDESLPDICRQTEPDVLILNGHYDEVSARYLIRHLQGESTSILPERILILSDNPGAETALELPTGVQGFWISMSQLPKALSEDFTDEPQAQTPSILHITDDRFLQKVISDLIHRETSYNLLSASSGLQGLEIYRSDHPDLILTDWDLPDIDGIELCRRIKVEYADTRTEVALFSSFADEHLIEEAYRVHAKAYIVKPVKPELLLRKIKRILDHEPAVQ